MIEEISQNAIPRRTFEALFVRGLRADGLFTESLREVGYDLKRPQPSYPRPVWRASLEVARHYYYGHLSYEEAYRELGRKFAASFVDTVFGRVLSSLVPLIGPERLMALIPYYIGVARPEISVKAKPLGDRHWQLEFTDANPLPDFVAGTIEASLRVTRVEPQVHTVDRSGGFDLVVTW